MIALDPINALSGIPPGLRNPLLDEYSKLTRHFREGRWEPAELNGGKLCEVVYSILKGHVDGKFPAGPSKPRNMLAACASLEQAIAFPRTVRIQIPRMLIALYEVRNNRNVGHVGADVNPNEMDASVVLAMSKWVMAELVRIFHAVTTEEAAAIVEGITERTLPILWQVGDRTRVLSSGLSAKDKTLALLWGSPGPLNVRDIARSIEYGNVSRLRTDVLRPAHKADLIDFDEKADKITLSPVGVRYVEEQIPLTI